MNFKIVAGIVICAVVVLFIFSGKEDLADKLEVEPTKTSDTRSVEQVSPEGSKEDTLGEADVSEASNAKNQMSPMDQLFQKVSKLSMFDQRRLDELRLEAYQWMSENPKEFEDFTLKKVGEAEKHSVESMFFFVEAYTKKHPNAAEGVNEILGMHSEDKGHSEEGHAHVGGTQKQNMTKAFALEVYFDRLDKEGGSDDESLGKIESSIKSIIEKDDDLMLVRQGVMVLRNYMDYESSDLQELVETRANSSKEGHALSDLLKD